MFDLKNSAVVEGSETLSGSFISGSAEITLYNENTVSIKTTAEGSSFLVLTDSYYPTWKATIDGIPVKITYYGF